LTTHVIYIGYCRLIGHNSKIKELAFHKLILSAKKINEIYEVI